MKVAILESTEAEAKTSISAAYILLSSFDLNPIQNQVFGLIALSLRSLFSIFLGRFCGREGLRRSLIAGAKYFGIPNLCWCSLSFERFRKQVAFGTGTFAARLLALYTAELKTPLEKEWYAAGKTTKWRLWIMMELSSSRDDIHWPLFTSPLV